MGKAVRIPLAWKQLMHEKRRLGAAVAGITFAVVLILVQIGFQDALMKSATAVHRSLDADLVMISPALEYFGSGHPIPEHQLYQALGVQGVEDVDPLYAQIGEVNNIETGFTRSLLIIGLNPMKRPLVLPGVVDHLEDLKVTGNILFDRDSRPMYGPVATTYEAFSSLQMEVESHRCDVKGLFGLGTSFIAYGNIITSDATWRGLFPNYREGLATLGLINVKPGHDPVRVRDQINSLIDRNDVTVITKAEFTQREIDYWSNTAAIGKIFQLGALMGLIVGMVIVYQILYTDVSDHLPEYATLKAMGYPDSYFSKLVLNESIILSLLGYPPGILISWGIYWYTSLATGWDMSMTWQKVIGVYLLTLFICCISGVLAMRRLKKADPAEIF
jgi:putative ABC transport system permease protein